MFSAVIALFASCMCYTLDDYALQNLTRAPTRPYRFMVRNETLSFNFRSYVKPFDMCNGQNNTVAFVNTSDMCFDIAQNDTEEYYISQDGKFLQFNYTSPYVDASPSFSVILRCSRQSGMRVTTYGATYYVDWNTPYACPIRKYIKRSEFESM
ncbi:uncharacterized protein MONOS_7036 [Monocercomonoides exilis]|uniref:uncharacterized protein n=1 Tax=Monocercomonoides exilis TaxID=2049356 RepID=UPI0035594442|nr:hypothetical protein MONOS_7036 [Monocercomonoides exilis]|eukprot:MONOS_7036.1-p1 / transcript=MONOS_7036.1 / gene=MONOS_7036 / organism=Monocercomonoides_exilis_PA203 / gene_product=unspecified product / transcript_product=unspecified product / location=Mono_scaffold00232:14593-15109(-) / protein_length=153 / sequence_SO=supercontig / SO=protein_coding / is_pseudo=false